MSLHPNFDGLTIWAGLQEQAGANVHKRILAMIIAMMVTVPLGLMLGLYGETTKEYRERRFSPQPKLTIRLQQSRRIGRTEKAYRSSRRARGGFTN